MMNMMTGAVAINGGVGVMEIRQPIAKKSSRKLQKVRKTMENKNEKSMTLEEMISEMLKDAKVVRR